MISRGEADRYNARHRQYYLDKFNHSCVHCGANSNLCIDHIVPISIGGVNSEDNIQVLCRSCNSSKGGKRRVKRDITEKKQRKIYLDDIIYGKAIHKADKDKRSFTKYVEILIEKDLEVK